MNVLEREKRLMAYSFAEGFDVFTNGGGSKKMPGVIRSRINHGDAIANRGKLNDRVIHESEGKMISSRKREATSVRQTSCSWRVRVS